MLLRGYVRGLLRLLSAGKRQEVESRGANDGKSFSPSCGNLFKGCRPFEGDRLLVFTLALIQRKRHDKL